MLPIFICDDDKQHLHKLKDIIQKCISEDNLDCKIVLTTQKGGEVLSHVEDDTSQKGIYFLDIELASVAFDGIGLGKIIQNMNPDNAIIYITSHEEKAYLVFKNYLDCTDFIAKDDWGNIERRISICLKKIGREEETKIHKQFIYNGKVVSLNRLLYIENAKEQHQIVFHYEESILKMWGSLKDVEKVLSDEFFRCSRSLIVNLKKVSYIDDKDNKIVFPNGSDCVTYGAGIRNLKKKGVKAIKQT